MIEAFTIRQAQSDKSARLESAAFSREEWPKLEEQIRTQLLPLPALLVRADE